ncbi:MAG: hypothetical protein N3G19_01775 [Candidatus Pacearchaeota archaeon]|nr:hypothetical protein [Candidatus Pacearchaeota archaeon]
MENKQKITKEEAVKCAYFIIDKLKGLSEEITASQSNMKSYYKILKKYEKTIRMCSAISKDTENALEILKNIDNSAVKSLYEQLKTCKENIKRWKQDLESLLKSNYQSN